MSPVEGILFAVTLKFMQEALSPVEGILFAVTVKFMQEVNS